MTKPEKCRFMKTHEWVSFESKPAVVGISDHAQHEITDVVFVEMPKAGRQVKKGEACGVIESVKAAFDIYAPVSGEVAAVNEKLAADPALVNRSPHDEGWLFKVNASNPDEAASLMDFAQYEQFIRSTAAK